MQNSYGYRCLIDACASILLLLLASCSVVWGDPLLYSQPARQKISLNSPDASWLLRRSDGTRSTAGTVPGDVYSDLLRAGVIDNPLMEFNDVKTRWIVKYGWTYETQFKVDASLLDSLSTIDLVLEGVDTVADVLLNGLTVLRCNNFWRVYRIEVKRALRPGRNSLLVQLSSPVRYAKQAARRYAAQWGYAVPPDCPPTSFNGECHFNFIRKPAYSFSWDWGPAVPTSGIWRPIYLDAYAAVAIDYVKFSASPKVGNAPASIWRAAATVGLKFSRGCGGGSCGLGKRDACLIGQIEGAAPPVKSCFTLPDEPDADNFTAVVNFNDVVNPKLWWPNGHGEQPLYSLKVALCSDGQACRHTSSETRRVAFRTIRLTQEPVGSGLADGLTFGFEVNGRQIFVRGSNFVPVGVAIAAAPVSDYEWLLRSAAEANINMLRVWGGGTIERPEFYDLTDQLGILVWQDFPFACALYPTDAEFLANVRSEIRDSVRRLQHRASVAAWVANNENEGALANKWWPLGSRSGHYYGDYRHLYMGVVRPTALAEDATRPMLLSSPTNGDATEWAGGVAEQPQSNRFGDVHYYSYTEDMWLTETIPLTRFMSEFGFQSHPSLITILSATRDPRNARVDSNFTLHREHQPNGTETIAWHNSRHFAREIPLWLVGINDVAIGRLLENYSLPGPEVERLKIQLSNYAYQSYASQVDQAEIYKRVTDLHLAHRCRLTDRQEGLSRGVMSWQLNDVWVAPTWSTIESTGVWKVAQHYAMRYYSNRRVAMLKMDGNVTAVYIADGSDSGTSATVVTFDCYDVNSLSRRQTWTVAVAVNGTINCPVELFTMQEAELIQKCNCLSANNCFLEATLGVGDGRSWRREASTYAEQYFFDFPKNFQRVASRKPQLTVNFTRAGQDLFTIQLKTLTPLYAVHLQFLCQSLAKASLSDNGFHVTSWTRTITLKVPHGWSQRSVEDISACLMLHFL